MVDAGVRRGRSGGRHVEGIGNAFPFDLLRRLDDGSFEPDDTY